jgi:hypothetical protein
MIVECFSVGQFLELFRLYARYLFRSAKRAGLDTAAALVRGGHLVVFAWEADVRWLVKKKDDCTFIATTKRF